jgi:hypothetical protein
MTQPMMLANRSPVVTVTVTVTVTGSLLISHGRRSAVTEAASWATAEVGRSREAASWATRRAFLFRLKRKL